MNSEVKQKWIDALRSGEYIQGQKNLESEGKFCCLGVLCDLAVKDGVPVLVTKDSRSRHVLDSVSFTRYDGSAAVLPEKVRNWAGLSYSDFDDWKLIEMNDGNGSGTRTYSFDQIADYIEKNL